SADHPKPKATICVWALAADSETEARHLMSTRAHWRVGREQGIHAALLPPEVAAAQSYSAAEQAIVERLRSKSIVGTADQVATRLRELASQLALDDRLLRGR